MERIQLIEKDETLYIPCEPNPDFAEDGTFMCLYIYPAGDCDLCEWPAPGQGSERHTKWMQRLGGVLFDAVEMGVIKADHGGFVAVLPDGTEFNYLDHVQ